MTTKKMEVEWYESRWPSIILPSVISWGSHDPLIINIRFGVSPQLNEAGDKRWDVSRDLLYDALTDGRAEWHGQGDVRACLLPITGRFHVILDNPHGHAELLTSAGELNQFLSDTYKECPRGKEDLSLDEELRRLLGKSS